MSGNDWNNTGGVFYDERMVLLPDVALLRPGDVLLTRTTPLAGPIKGAQSKKIRMRTGGAFSHALICTEPPVMVEAVGTGVSTLSLARCYAHGWESIRLLRHPDTTVAQTAGSAAQLQVGRDYSIRRALRSAFPEFIADRVADHGTFCSALVAQCYVGASDALFACVPVELTMPATIEHIEGLADITRDVFREGLAPRNIGRLVPLDAHREPSPSARQTVISGRYAKALMADAELLAAAMPKSPEIIPTHYGMIDLITNAMDAALAGFCGADVAVIAARMDADLREFIASGELADVSAELAGIEAEELQGAVRASFDHVPDIDRRAMEAQLATTRRSLVVRRRSIDNMERWNRDGRSAAVGAYTGLERETILNLERREKLYGEILTRLG